MREQVEEMETYVCDYLCKYRKDAADQEEMDRICDNCRLEELVNNLIKE